MSGSTGTGTGAGAPSKASWRQKARHLWSSKHSATPESISPEKSTSALPAANSAPVLPPPDHAAPVQDAAQPLAPVTAPNTGLSSSVSSTSTSPSITLLHNALQRVQQSRPQDRITLERHILIASGDIQLALRQAITAATTKRQVCENNRWSFRIGEKHVVLREQADKVLQWLQRFSTVGDIAANADPLHVGLPWAGIRLLLEVAVTDSKQMAALLAGCETVLYLASRLDVYLEFWQDLPSAAARNNLEESIVTLYAHILRFLARAIRVYDTSVARRVLSALWAVDDVVDFERTGHDLATKVEFDASNCDRTVDAQQHDTVSRLQHNMQQVLGELGQLRPLQTSMGRLQLKIDLGKIPYARGAIFNSSDGVHTMCHPATRTELLSQVQQWARLPDGRSIFWLHGGAGTGKSTISWTFSQWLVNQLDTAGVVLGASFFFKRGESDRNSGARFFATIVRQLILKIPGLDVLVAHVIESDPFIFDKALAEQFRRLILQPLQSPPIASAVQSTLVVVVDALDECNKEGDIRTILELWAQLSDVTTKIRLFLTSRPELAVRMQFRRLAVDLFQDIDLVSAVPVNTIQQDLSMYLNDNFRSIREEYNDRSLGESTLSDNWPGDQSIQRLVQMSDPLFIVAATICRFVGDLEFDPQETLEEVLNNRNTGRMSQMEQTYLPVLGHLTAKARDERQNDKLCHEFRDVVGSIIVLAEPLSADSLATLLGVTIQLIDRRLAPLHSVLRVPTDHYTPVQTLHLSFTEFLVGEAAQKQPFGISAPSAHMALSSHCLRVLSSPGGLRENVCDLDHPGKLRSEVESTTIASRVSSVVQYSCRHWIYHVRHSCRLLEDDGEVHLFIKKHFLHWLEALSLMNRISQAIGLLADLRSCVSATARSLSDLLEDARRFVLAHRFVIDLAPLQLYSSAIIFSPQLSLIRTLYDRVPDWLLQYPRTTREWGPELQKLQGHLGPVRDVSFSPDGSLLASGSEDETIRLWNTRTGQEVQRLDGHSSSVYAVSFSPGGILASGSKDSTVRLWDIQTGREVWKFKDGREAVNTVSFSPDGLLLAVGYEEGTVRIFDVRTGQELQRLDAHSKLVKDVEFSPDGLLVASGSFDRTVRLWDVETGRELSELTGHSSWVNDVSFSPDGTLAAGSSDGTVSLWNIQTGREVRKLRGEFGVLRAVSFSRDGSVLAAGSSDQKIRLWNTHKDWELSELKGHSDLIDAVSFSPDGALLASGSDDDVVQLWDPQIGPGLEELERHSDRVSTLLFSPNGCLLASGSADNTVCLWNTQTGRKTHKLEGHTDWISVISFTLDGALLASGSGDGTIRLWSVQTGHELQTLEGHEESITTVSFTLDGALLASGSYDGTIRLWSVQTGHELQKLECHEGRDTTLSFTPDEALLASGSSDGTIRLCSTQTAHTFMIIEGNPVLTSISVLGDKTLIADEGTSETSGPIPLAADSVPPVRQPAILVVDDWVQREGRNLLWLPREYRGRHELYGDVLAIGADSGRVGIFRFKFEEELPNTVKSTERGPR